MEQNDISKWLRGIAYEIAFWNNVYRWKWTFQGMMNWSHYGKAIDLELFDANAFLAPLDNAQLLQFLARDVFRCHDKHNDTPFSSPFFMFVFC